MANRYFPALIIGAGGTGIKVCRYLQSIADAGLDDNLAQRLANGSLQMVGIDTDKKSNEDENPIDPYMLDTRDTPEAERERIPGRMSLLPRNWLHLDRAALNHAIERVHEVISPGDVLHDGEETYHEPLATIRRWFPLKNEKTGDQITKGHSKLSGAAQWRPLGRMALFLNAQRIYETLHKTYKIVQQSDPEQGPVRAFIICSLAGGTGSGMFWDLAFFLQMIDPSTRTNGMFLLGDPFEGIDEAGRIYPNIYASLKEIATYKNWRESLTVKYPISRGRVFKGQPQGPLAYDMVYLYQAFPPGQDVTDVAKGMIDTTCYRIGQNLLSLLRTDLHAELDVGANNVDSDATAMASQLESTYCFSTTGATIFNLRDPDQIANYISGQVIAALHHQAEDPPPPLGPDSLAEALSLPDSDDALADYRSQLLEGAGEERPRIVDEQIKRLDEVVLEGEENQTASAKDLLQSLGDSIRGGLEKAFSSGDNQLSVGSMRDNFEKRFDQNLADLEEKLIEIIADLKRRDQKLQPEAEEAARRLARSLETDLPEGDGDGEIKVSLPTGFKKIKHADRPAGAMTPFQALINRTWNWLTGRNWAQESHNMGVRELIGGLRANLTSQTRVKRSQIEPLLNQIWNKHRPRLKALVDELLENSKEISARHRRRQVEEQKIRQIFESDEGEAKGFGDDQMNELLRSILPPTSDGDEWLARRTKELLGRLRRHYPDRKEGDEMVPQVKEDQVRSALDELIVDLRKQYQLDPGNLAPELLVRFIKECIPFSNPDTGEEASQIVPKARSAARDIVEYWSSLGNLITQQAGGRQALRERLLRCRSKLFASGIIENKISKKHLVVLPFGKQNRQYSEEDKRRIKETLDVVAQEVMHTGSTVVYQQTDRPLIYFDDLFRSAEEIARIRDYYNSYSTYTEDGNTTFFHIDRGMAGIADIVGDAIEIHPVHCGNLGCEYNLRTTPRTKLVCPGCNKPVWNRCGNRKCYADTLRSIIEETHTGSGKVRYPYDCPACHSELKTYWWKCPEPSHAKKIPADKETCPQCLIENQQGIRDYEEIYRRPDLRDRECPGCMKLEDNPDDRTRIPHALTPFYKNGVNGHDSIHFSELVVAFKDDPKYRIQAHLCPNTGTEHFIFPTCPQGRGDSDKRHHLYLNEDDRFVCTRHPELHFYGCHYCHYPLLKGENYANGCPRCLRPVSKCDYCSEKFNHLYTPMKNTNPERCPNCRNLMQRNPMIDPEEVVADMKDPAFCANIFSCPAGTELWLTAGDYELKECRACPEPASPLMPHGDLRRLVDDCPLCSMVLSPIAINGRHAYRSGRDIAQTFSEKITNRGAETLDRTCKICGSDTRFILSWMQTDGYFGNGKHPRDQSPEGQEAAREDKADVTRIEKALENYPFKRPELGFDEALETLTVLREEPDDRRAFYKLKQAMGMEALIDADLHRQESLLDAFEKGSRAGLTLRRRLAGLWRYQQELKDRTEQWVHKPERR